MTTCINRDLSVGVDADSMTVLDWLNIRTCQQIPSVMTHLSFRPYDVQGQAHRLDLYWVPGFARVDLASGRFSNNPLIGPSRFQCKAVAWSGDRQGWWASSLFAKKTYGGILRATAASKSLTCFYRRDPTTALPVTVRSGFGLTLYRKAAPNLHSGVSVGFPRRLNFSLCADVFRRWTASVSYTYSSLVASARFAGNVATKADSVFEVAVLLKLHSLWDALGDGSALNMSWTRDGLAFGTVCMLDKGVWRGEDGIRGGIPVSISLSALLPIGQPLGGVEETSAGSAEELQRASGGRGFRMFFGLELRPWVSLDNQDDVVLSDDPLAVFPMQHRPASPAHPAAPLEAVPLPDVLPPPPAPTPLPPPPPPPLSSPEPLPQAPSMEEASPLSPAAPLQVAEQPVASVAAVVPEPKSHEMFPSEPTPQIATA